MLKPFANEDCVYRPLGPVQRAPSARNAQPWWFRIAADDRIDIRARSGAELAMNGNEWSQISAISRREALISCGAALYNLRLAIRVTGHDLVVWPFPRDSDPSVLASLEIVTGRTKTSSRAERELYDAINRRHTNSWPYDDRHHVPAGILAVMQVDAAREDGLLHMLNRRQARRWLREA